MAVLNDEEKKAELTALIHKAFSAWFSVLDKRVETNSSKDHIVGDNWTIADFALLAFFGSTAFNETSRHHAAVKEELDKHEHLKHYAHSMHHAFEEYFKNRPQPRPF